MSEDADKRGAARDDRGGDEELIAVARIVKTRGVRGEVAAHLLTDFPERFDGLEELIAVDAAGKRETLAIEKSWLHGGRVILKFAGYESPEAAQVLVGRELAVPEQDAVELEDDEFYDWQLIDCRVETIDKREVGRVTEVLHTGAAPVLVVKDGAREHLLPLAESICVEVDLEAKFIRVDPPEGLLEF
jgi:16S rRNA processing protein RimM